MEESRLVLAVFALFILVFLIIWHIAFQSVPQLPLPPGPKANWLVGHTFQVPQKKAWLYFEKLGKEFGMYDLASTVSG